ncbi:hypothetical protein FACS1894170_13060 [Planctomycetales bacterium]|nr:hypothetical protein FACS1894170_13060 [Planctomycetales bacterium]
METTFRTKPILETAPQRKDVHRPWGVMRQFVHNGECTVNVLTVKPGMRLSLQSHTARAELWIILDDSARIQVGDEIRDYKSGDEVWIPVYEKHRLSNVGTEPIRVLEITFGNWQQEDIERFEDDFSRPAVGE